MLIYLLLLTTSSFASNHTKDSADGAGDDELSVFAPKRGFKEGRSSDQSSPWIPIIGTNHKVEQAGQVTDVSAAASSSVARSQHQTSAGSGPIRSLGGADIGSQLLQQDNTGNPSVYDPNGVSSYSGYNRFNPAANYHFLPSENNVPTTYSFGHGSGVPTYGGLNLISSSGNPQQGHFLISDTKIVTKTEPGGSDARQSKNKNAQQNTADQRYVTPNNPLVSTQDLTSLYQQNGNPYANFYSPSTTQSFALPNSGGFSFNAGRYVQPSYPLNYNYLNGGGQQFGNLASFSSPSQLSNSPQTQNTKLSDEKQSNDNNNGQHQGSFSNPASSAPYTFGGSYFNPYGTNLLNGNSFPTLTTQPFSLSYQPSPNNVVNNRVLPTSFSSGIYHGQPYLSPNGFQKQPLFVNQANTFGNTLQQQYPTRLPTTSHPRPQPVTQGPPKDSYLPRPEAEDDRNKYTETNTENTYSSDDDDDDKEVSKLSPHSEYHESSKYSSDDDSKSTEDDDDDEDSHRNERYKISYHSGNDDEDDDDDRGGHSSGSSSSYKFPSQEEFFKTSRPSVKSSYHDHHDDYRDRGSDHSSSSTVEDIFKPHDYYSKSFHNEEPFFAGASFTNEKKSKKSYEDSYRKAYPDGYRRNTRGRRKPGSPYQVQEKVQPDSFHSYKYKTPSYADARSTEYLETPGPVQLSYRGQHYEKYSEPDTDSEGGHSEYNPRSLNKKITKENKKGDYYSYSFTKRKVVVVSFVLFMGVSALGKELDDSNELMTSSDKKTTKRGLLGFGAGYPAPPPPSYGFGASPGWSGSFGAPPSYLSDNSALIAQQHNFATTAALAAKTAYLAAKQPPHSFAYPGAVAANAADLASAAAAAKEATAAAIQARQYVAAAKEALIAHQRVAAAKEAAAAAAIQRSEAAAAAGAAIHRSETAAAAEAAIQRSAATAAAAQAAAANAAAAAAAHPHPSPYGKKGDWAPWG
uniref:(California timema) hypothetical protein n=1 Tax=Timema californicum TaxID=61474 RepID=A0A7R9JBI7_TIMCA|nr:unnamed protein product [Timema californicum]